MSEVVGSTFYYNVLIFIIYNAINSIIIRRDDCVQRAVQKKPPIVRTFEGCLPN